MNFWTKKFSKSRVKSLSVYTFLTLFSFSLFSIVGYTIFDIKNYSPSEVVEGLDEESLKFGKEKVLSDHDSVWDDYFSVIVKKGDSFTDVLAQAGVDDEDAAQVSKSINKVLNVRGLSAGQEILVSFSEGPAKDDIKLASLKIEKSDKDIEVSRSHKGDFVAKETLKKLKKKVVRAEAIIASSLFQSGADSGIPANVMLDIIKILSYDVDFQRDIRSGDKLHVLFEAYFDSKGKKIRNGEILFTSLSFKDGSLKIYRHTTKGGEADYFTEDGKSVKKALLRTPINGARLSSGFGMRRHPVMGYTKMHKGVDFAAPTGTPIFAAGNAVVDFSGWKNGYGNFVKLRHNSEYATAYGHMSRIAKNVKRGTRVKQGEVIGYVGSTGRSTGPHLHYETIVRGAQVNPMKIKNVPGIKLAGGRLSEFQKKRKVLDELYASLPVSNAQLAMNNIKSSSN